MKIQIKNILLLLFAVGMLGCSKKDLNYQSLITNGEIYYPGVITRPNFRAGNLRTMLVWNPSPDPNITKYKIYWNNKLDSLIVPAATHNTSDTVKTLVPNLKEGSYSFSIYSVDNQGHASIAVAINNVRVFGPIYQSGIFNRGYNADTPYVVNLTTGSVKLKFNKPDSINLYTVVNYIDNTGKTSVLSLRPDSNGITLPNFKFGTDVTYQSSYIPLKGAIDIFTVAAVSTYPTVKRIGDVTSFYIKNPGAPFVRSDNGTGKWGLPKDWVVNSNAINQNNFTGGGWSTDNGGCIHFEAQDYSGNGVSNGKVSQSISLPAGTYALDFVTAGYGGTLSANEIVAVGTTLPDITNLGTPLAIFKGDQNSIGGTHTLNFTLTQSTTVTIGWVVNTSNYTYLQFTKVVLRSL